MPQAKGSVGKRTVEGKSRREAGPGARAKTGIGKSAHGDAEKHDDKSAGKSGDKNASRTTSKNSGGRAGENRDPEARAPGPEPRSSKPPSDKRRASARTKEERQQKFDRILDAALAVFSEKGFAESRLEDVAQRAGVAKGTLYLYVPSKQALFEALVRSGIGGPIGAIEKQVASLDASAETQLRALFDFFRVEILGTRRRDIVRLLLSEADRVPGLAAFYHREVLSRGLAMLRGIATRALESGEFKSDELVRFPQLAVAPAIVSLIWSHLFQNVEPIDMEAMFEAHLAVLMRAMREKAR